MAKIYQLPKLYHPDFALPGVKPKGPIEIDWDNSITRGMVACVPLQGVPIDLVTGKMWTVAGATWNGDHSLEFTNATSDQLTCPDSFDFYGAGGFGVALVYTHIDTASGAFLTMFSLDQSAHNTTAFAQFRDNTDTLELFIAGTSKSATGAMAGDGLTQTHVFAGGQGVGTKNYIYYQDGTELINTTGSVATTNTAMTPAFGSVDNLGSRALNGQLRFGCIWIRELSPGEAVSLSLNPYQILRPQIPLTYFVPAAAAGGNEPLFYHHQRMLSRCS